MTGARPGSPKSLLKALKAKSWLKSKSASIPSQRRSSWSGAARPPSHGIGSLCGSAIQIWKFPRASNERLVLSAAERIATTEGHAPSCPKLVATIWRVRCAAAFSLPPLRAAFDDKVKWRAVSLLDSTVQRTSSLHECREDRHALAAR